MAQRTGATHAAAKGDVVVSKRDPESFEIDGDKADEKEKAAKAFLAKWDKLDVGAIVLAAAKATVTQRPVLVSFWVIGLLIAAFAGGLPVDAAAREAYSFMFQQAEVVDARELGRALEQLSKDEEAYYKVKGWFGSCEGECVQALGRVQLAKADVDRLKAHRDQLLSDARHEIGIWSNTGVQDVRDQFWTAWKAGKDFAARMTMYDAMFAVAGRRDESFYAMVLRLILQYVVNVTIGLIGAFFAFIYNVYYLILSYGESALSGFAFLFLATIAGLSVLGTYICGMYAAVAGGGMLLMQQAAKQAALEASQKNQRKGLPMRPGAGRATSHPASLRESPV